MKKYIKNHFPILNFQTSKYVSKEPTQSNFIDSEEGLKSEASTLQSPSPTHAPICDLNEPYASVIRSIAEKRIKETSTATKLVQSSMSSKEGTTRYFYTS